LTLQRRYGGYQVAKTVSYKVFYEDMVIETVRRELDRRESASQ
jgi:hypothetical protein